EKDPMRQRPATAAEAARRLRDLAAAPTVSGPAPDIRRLPVYILIDSSLSMAGEPMAAIRQGLKGLLSDLRSVAMAVETAWLSVITFASRARQVVPLTELLHFEEPDLRADTEPGVDLGGALRCFLEAVQREVVPTTREKEGDYMPLSVILVSEPS